MKIHIAKDDCKEVWCDRGIVSTRDDIESFEVHLKDAILEFEDGKDAVKMAREILSRLGEGLLSPPPNGKVSVTVNYDESLTEEDIARFEEALKKAALQVTGKVLQLKKG